MDVFLHISKSGGSTIRGMFRLTFGAQRVLEVSKTMAKTKAGEPNVTSPSDFRRFSGLTRFRAIAGHLSMDQIHGHRELKRMIRAKDVRVFTSIRDPIDRIISIYNFALGNKQHPAHDKVQDMDPFVFLLDLRSNMQTKRLGLGSSFANTRDILANVNCLTLDRSVEQIRTYLQNSYSVDLSKATSRNVTNERFPELTDRFIRKDDLAPGQLALLNERHQDDLELYRMAKEKRWDSFVALGRPSKNVRN